MTTKNKNTQQLNGIILLNGEKTISGQINVRTKTIKSCFDAIKNRSANVHPNILRSFIKSHKETLRELYFRKFVYLNSDN